MKILLVNLFRFGDILQTQAAITDYKRLGYEVGLICLDTFAGTMELLEDLSYGKAFPATFFNRLLLNACGKGEVMLSAEQKPAWLQALEALYAWRDTLQSEFAYDCLGNLGASVSARFLTCFLAEERKIFGFSLDADGSGINTTPWAALFLACAENRYISPFNLVDLFRRIVCPYGTGQSREELRLQENIFSDNAFMLRRPPPAIAEKISAHLKETAPVGTRKFAAFQLGASLARRQWPVASFAQVGDFLWQEHQVCPVLLGSAQELGLVEEYSKSCTQPFLSLVGKTNLLDLSAALMSMEFLLSNDTGTMHLAAGLRIPIVSIFLSTAQVFDTGPYLNDCLAFEPDCPCHPCSFKDTEFCTPPQPCLFAVTSELLIRYIDALVRRKNFPQIRDGGARVWTSYFDEEGFLCWASLSGHECAERTMWQDVQYFSLKRLFARLLRQNVPQGVFDRQLVFSKKTTQEVQSELQFYLILLELLVRQSELLKKGSTGKVKKSFVRNWMRLFESLRQSVYFKIVSYVFVGAAQIDWQDWGGIDETLRSYQIFFEEIKKLVSDN